MKERAAIDGKWVTTTGAKDIAALRAMTTDQVLEAAKKKGMTGFAPVIDGKFLTEPVSETYAVGKQAHVPLLAGWNADEGSFAAMQRHEGSRSGRRGRRSSSRIARMSF